MDDEPDQPEPDPTLPSVHQAIARVMGDLPAVGKNRQADPSMGGYSYRGIDDLYNALAAPMSRHGVFLTYDVEHREVTHYTTGRNNTQMRLVEIQVRYHWWGPAGDHVDVVTFAEAADAGDKATNKALSFALKYMLLQVLMVAVDDAPDPDAFQPDLGGGQQQANPPAQADDSERHAELVAEVERFHQSLPEGLRPDHETLMGYARANVANAQAALDRLHAIAADAPSQPSQDESAQAPQAAPQAPAQAGEQPTAKDEPPQRSQELHVTLYTQPFGELRQLDADFARQVHASISWPDGSTFGEVWEAATDDVRLAAIEAVGEALDAVKARQQAPAAGDCQDAGDQDDGDDADSAPPATIRAVLDAVEEAGTAQHAIVGDAWAVANAADVVTALREGHVTPDLALYLERQRAGGPRKTVTDALPENMRRREYEPDVT